ncbi:2-(3-amino-3-carboxypropyl)histidine synthase subunit 2-like [Anneissia japonica]|uniref:2-(3-amino-3-carboxypropyl)histidine synthase subunit 2-like n=1 Tax=Anneissia japonica TaxID=1529436 RepID=UPI0014256F26|nr:2-(3-amino-3-carboxypropyl)histidine synthase subunit 2-like [Anneissia japonica]XP_033116297.1 2-(3-amino-3-carboxypropyl)histidine synthase subunit 2-like [Anneissia japonica]
MDAFFSNVESVFDRKVEHIGYHDDLPIDATEYFEIQTCVQFVNRNNFKCVALQFPDSLLEHSTVVVHQLQERTESKFYILADTSYGSCCVDEIAALHVNAEAIIHFGRSCMSPTGRLPVLLVFGRQPVDLDLCESAFRETFTPDQQVLIISDVVYSYCSGDMLSRLHGDFKSLVVSTTIDQQTCKEFKPKGSNEKTSRNEEAKTKDEANSKSENVYNQFGRRFVLPKGKDISDYQIFYIGGQSITLTNFLMTFNKCTFFTFDPATNFCRRETLDVNRALMKRYYMIEKAKDANVIGIVAGTLGVKDYLSIITRLKALIKRMGKKSYTFVMGKLNVPKMANFTEVDVYVLVACPENSLIDSKEFYRPIITPFEMEIACNEAREWTGVYVTDFRQLLPGAVDYVPFVSDDPVKLQPDVSLVTGSVRRMGIDDEEKFECSGGALIKRDDALSLSTVHVTPGQFLSERSWQGLQQKLGETPVTLAVQGRKGIAASYTHETDGEAS